MTTGSAFSQVLIAPRPSTVALFGGIITASRAYNSAQRDASPLLAASK
jgi:hypothetical protein